ncbi:hypothetical protein OG930_03345 [Streptomyces sp. NBC_01799]|uniref:hypothetical protein n=1 Tax=Streptomyces sp. NBC_01800 TaxID=2975945 RepID=UPI002DD8FC57|nr:hypothetical protein [Streptomyces sp. NBC_01800]WSA66126.1 hypothetical protein OIE65_03430 [Streptomyces sp. NBC_01800]WSA74727.1 hypothetical protein OG930_03345 [Streptomyces sp. NBC_01799]
MYTSGRRTATSVLVIGTGGSGLRATIELVEPRADVLAMGKRPKMDAHTSLRPVERAAIPSIPDDIAALMREVSTAGKPVE